MKCISRWSWVGWLGVFGVFGVFGACSSGPVSAPPPVNASTPAVQVQVQGASSNVAGIVQGVVQGAGGQSGLLLSPPEDPREVPELPTTPARDYQRPQIQLALLLDVSGSMSGLLNQARAELWSVVNAFDGAVQSGVESEIQVALYSYGNPERGGGLYLQQEVPLTTDLDTVSEKLFALSTDGSEEYCGAVIKAASLGLEWSGASDHLKAVIIAGNEPFNQGPISSEDGLKSAGERSIVVHTVYCGDSGEGIEGGWKAGAMQGGGRYSSINHNATLVHIDAPQDDEIVRLGEQLNKTYLPYGEGGKVGANKQRAQDQNARKMSKASVVARTVTKSGKSYRNTHWDLIDSLTAGSLKLDSLDPKALPPEMRSMSLVEQKQYIAGKAAERGRVQAKIKGLNQERDAFVVAERQKRAAHQEGTLNSAMTTALRAQASALGFTWGS